MLQEASLTLNMLKWWNIKAKIHYQIQYKKFYTCICMCTFFSKINYLVGGGIFSITDIEFIFLFKLWDRTLQTTKITLPWAKTFHCMTEKSPSSLSHPATFSNFRSKRLGSFFFCMSFCSSVRAAAVDIVPYWWHIN